MDNVIKAMVLLCCGCTQIHYHIEVPPPQVWESSVELKTRTSLKTHEVEGIDATISLKHKW